MHLADTGEFYIERHVVYMFLLHVCNDVSGRSRISQMEGSTNVKDGGANLLIWPFSQKLHRIEKNNWIEDRRP